MDEFDSGSLPKEFTNFKGFWPVDTIRLADENFAISDQPHSIEDLDFDEESFNFRELEKGDRLNLMMVDQEPERWGKVSLVVVKSSYWGPGESEGMTPMVAKIIDDPQEFFPRKDEVVIRGTALGASALASGRLIQGFPVTYLYNWADDKQRELIKKAGLLGELRTEARVMNCQIKRLNPDRESYILVKDIQPKPSKRKESKNDLDNLKSAFELALEATKASFNIEGFDEDQRLIREVRNNIFIEIDHRENPEMSIIDLSAERLDLHTIYWYKDEDVFEIREKGGEGLGRDKALELIRKNPRDFNDTMMINSNDRALLKTPWLVRRTISSHGVPDGKSYLAYRSKGDGKEFWEHPFELSWGWQTDSFNISPEKFSIPLKTGFDSWKKYIDSLPMPEVVVEGGKVKIKGKKDSEVVVSRLFNTAELLEKVEKFVENEI